MRSLNTLSTASALVLALSIATVSANDARAFYIEERGTDTQVPIRYIDGTTATADTVDVEYRINTSTLPSGVTAADIDGAFTAWSSADCSNLSFTAGAGSASTDISHWTSDAIDTSTAGMPTGDIYVLVFFTDSVAEWTGGPAVGHFYFAHDGTGTLIGGTVVLNSRDHTWTTDGTTGTLDVQSTVTALAGRSIGITSNMEGNATYPRYTPGDTSKRVLGADDVAAVQFLYPMGGTCAAPAAPEAVCDGVMLPGEDPCPPPVMTNPGDGGTAMPVDAGSTVTPTPDAGTGTGTEDAGTGAGDDGGCSVGAVGTTGSSAPIALLMLGAALLRRRRRG